MKTHYSLVVKVRIQCIDLSDSVVSMAARIVNQVQLESLLDPMVNIEPFCNCPWGHNAVIVRPNCRFIVSAWVSRIKLSIYGMISMPDHGSDVVQG
jgi:hypothetical protein